MKNVSFLKGLYAFLFISLTTFSAQAQYTLIPDVNFEKRLINLGIDTDGANGKVLTSNLSTVKILPLEGMEIRDLTGIHDFVNLEQLLCDNNLLTQLELDNPKLVIVLCNNNLLTSIDVGKCSALRDFTCYYNQLTYLDITKNKQLKQLGVAYNQLTSIDVSQNLLLYGIGFQNNFLTNVDVTQNSALTSFDCSYNKLSSLDISKNVKLESFSCNGNQLSSLDVSKNSKLMFLGCFQNHLTSLDVSENIVLQSLNCRSNQLTKLDLSKNINLNDLYCDNNQLTRLDLTKNVNTRKLTCKDNPALEICVRDIAAAYSNVNYQKDPDQAYVNYCTESIIIQQNNVTQSVCLNKTFSSIAVSVTGSNLTYQWYKSTTATTENGISLGSAAQTSIYFPQSSEVGTSYYYCIISNSFVEATSSVFGPFVVNTLPAPTITSPLNYCVGAAAVPLSATGTNLKWYTSPNSGTGNTIAPTPSTTVSAVIIYYVSQSNGTCESERTSIIVDVNTRSTPPLVTSSLDYCLGATALPLTANGSDLKWYETQTSAASSTAAPVPSTSVVGFKTYYVSQTVSGCESERSVITVNTTAKPAAPVVVSPVNYCEGSASVNLTASGNNLLWYQTELNSTGTTAALLPSTTLAGSTNYFVSQVVDGCESLKSLITVQIHAPVSLPIVTTNVNYCIGETAQPLVATGTNLKWYTLPNSGSANVLAPTPATAVSGTTIYYVSQTVEACESNRAAILVQVNAQPVSPPVTDKVNYCVGTTALPLTASGSNLKWYTQAIGGASDVVVPTPATNVVTVKDYYVSQSLNGCESDRSKITVTVVTAPAAPVATSPVRYCVGSATTALTATGSNLYWFSPVNGCTASGAAPIPSTLVAGTTSYFVSQTVGTCESVKKEIVVIVTAGPQVPVVVSPVNLSVGAASLALTATGSNLKWYTTATGGAELSSAPIPSTAVAGVTDYYVSQTINGCESARTLIRVNVGGDISGPACFNIGGTASYQLNSALTTNAIYYNWWVNGSVQLINASGAQATVSVGQYYTTGEICVGINYNQAPWNKQVCRKIDLCSSSLRLANTDPEISVFPNPSTENFTINTSDDIGNVTIFNALGQNVYYIGTVTAGSAVSFGKELPAGMYVVQYQINNLKYTKSIIKQ